MDPTCQLFLQPPAISKRSMATSSSNTQRMAANAELETGRCLAPSLSRAAGGCGDCFSPKPKAPIRPEAHKVSCLLPSTPLPRRFRAIRAGQMVGDYVREISLLSGFFGRVPFAFLGSIRITNAMRGGDLGSVVGTGWGSIGSHFFSIFL
jgi:hypothetical protein